MNAAVSIVDRGRGAATRDEIVDDLLQLARFHQQRDVLDADLPVHLRQIERLLLHELDEGAQVPAPGRDRRGETLLLRERVVIRVVDVLLQLRLLPADSGERLVDLRAEFVAFLRRGGGEQHLLRAARAQHEAAHFFGGAARDIALPVDRFRGAIQATDLRERNHADSERARQHEREGEPQ